ncbi:hypothetical protein Ancab_022363 [Ancistrocladus abbreviatus]
MLAVFDQSVAKSPEGQKNSQSRASGSALKDGLLVRHFNSLHPDAVSFNHGVSSFMAFSSDKQNPLLPRMLVEVSLSSGGRILKIASFSLMMLKLLRKSVGGLSLLSLKGASSHPLVVCKVSSILSKS